MTEFKFGGLGCSKMRTLRKSGEPVEIIAFFNMEDGARNNKDWVSYIDSKGNEHIKEHLNIQFDFKDDDPLKKQLDGLLEQTKMIDPWESRRYELVQKMVIDKGLSVDDAVFFADSIIAKLKPSCPEPPGAVCAE